MRTYFPRKHRKFEIIVMPPIEAAYLTGMFDGEGSVFSSVYYYKDGSKKDGSKRFNFRIQICIANTNMEVLEYIKSITGTGTITQSVKIVGSKPAYRWILSTHSGVYEFLKCVQPYSIIKREQIKTTLHLMDVYDKVILAGESPEHNQEIWDLAAELKKLNHRGESQMPVDSAND